MTENNVGATIAKLRKEAGLTQAQLSEKLSLANTTVSSWETGNSKPNSDDLLRLAELFGVSIDYLVTGEDRQANAPLTKEQKIQSVMRHGLVCIEELLKFDDIDFIKEVLDNYPIHYYEYLKKLLKEKKYKELFKFSVDYHLDYEYEILSEAYNDPEGNIDFLTKFVHDFIPQYICREWYEYNFHERDTLGYLLYVQRMNEEYFVEFKAVLDKNKKTRAITRIDEAELWLEKTRDKIMYDLVNKPEEMPYTKMDKYQKVLLGGDLTDELKYCFAENPAKKAKCEFNPETDTFTVYQDDDITSTVYNVPISSDFVFNGNSAHRYKHIKNFRSVMYTKDGEHWYKAPVGKRYDCDGYILPLDFNNRTTAIKFVFPDGFAEDYVINIKYVEADKEAYYKKQNDEAMKELEKAAGIRYSAGQGLVNIAFKPCTENYERCEIDLYEWDGVHNGGESGYFKLKTYKVPQGDFFLPIQGLAYGCYAFKLRQYGKDGKLIFETGYYYEFKLNPPYSGRPNCLPGC